MPPYQGARARSETGEGNRVFAVSKVRLDPGGLVTDVLWGEVNKKSNLDVSAALVAPVADVVDAIHAGAEVVAVFPSGQSHLPERSFAVFEHDDGRETIAFEGPVTNEREVRDMARLDS